MNITQINTLGWWLLVTFLPITGCITDQANQHRHTQAKNIILFIGDGMGVTTVTAARILEGQLRGESGEENLLSFEHFPHIALSKTYNSNQQTPDSAGSMSAIMTGEKTRAGVISVNQHARRNDCKGSRGKSLQTFLEQAELSGKSTGVVTTTRLTHATPAATFAHSPQRQWEGDSDMPAIALQDGCKDIAAQLIEFPYGDGLDVALGGGRQYFIPTTQTDPELTGTKGQRLDGRDLIQEWLATENAAYVWNQAQLEKVNLKTTNHLLGLFNYSHMQYETDRKQDPAGEPSLTQMTTSAIGLLEQNPHGYFLMVEGGRIDHAHHAGNAYRALTDTIEFANAVAAARNLTHADDTLILVTADHSHAFTLAGYPTRGNPILGKVIGNDIFGEPETEPKLAKDGMPYTTLGYQNGAGFSVRNTSTLTHILRTVSSGRKQDLSTVDTGRHNFHQQALVPLILGTHGGEDVVIYADGPGANRVHGVIEQNIMFQIMRAAMDLK